MLSEKQDAKTGDNDVWLMLLAAPSAGGRGRGDEDRRVKRLVSSPGDMKELLRDLWFHEQRSEQKQMFW